MSTSKESISYVMVNNVETLQKLVEQIQTVETPNFTRLVLSFVQPSLPKYEDNNLVGKVYLVIILILDHPHMNKNLKSKKNKGLKI